MSHLALSRSRAFAAVLTCGLALVAGCAGDPPPPAEVESSLPAGTNVVLISIDTLRADRLGSYGYERPTSPELDAFAAAGVRFARAISQAPWTTPSHMSLFTSLYPTVHGVNQSFRDFQAFRNGKGGYRVLSPEVPTLAEILQQAGYRTGALTGGGTLSAELGFARGFEVFEDSGLFRVSDRAWTRLAQWLDEHQESPFFLFFHTFEVHTPYTRLSMIGDLMTEAEAAGFREVSRGPSRGLWRRMEAYLEDNGLLRADVLSALYDGGIRAADAFMGRLFADLEARGLADRTLVIVTSDHGEELGDHQDFGHGRTLYDEQIHVPLLLRMPGIVEPGTVVEDPVELIDVLPTILDLLDLLAPAGIQGQSLVPLMTGRGSPESVWTLSEATGFHPEMKSLRSRDTKYVAAFKSRGRERSGLAGAPIWERLYDLEQDPGEQTSRHLKETELLQAMRRRLVETFGAMELAGGGDETTAVSDETRERLRALGYID